MNESASTKRIETALLDNLSEFAAFARQRIADPELAADVVQDSLLKAIKSVDQLKTNENIRAWFYRILRRTIIDLYRHRDVQKRALETLEAESTSETETTTVLCRCLDRLIPTLKPEYADIIREIDLNNMAPDALAKKLGTTPNNVNVRLHRARNQLRERLEQTCKICSTHGCLDCTCDSEH